MKKKFLEQNEEKWVAWIADSLLINRKTTQVFNFKICCRIEYLFMYLKIYWVCVSE